jgi:hypothetical protein
LLLVAALAGGDYLLWTWSSSGASSIVALISGLALAPLILALIWLATAAVARRLFVPAKPRDAPATRRSRTVQRLLLAARRPPARPRRRSDAWEQDELEPAARRPSEKIAA